MIDKIKQILKSRFKKDNLIAYVRVFGCQQNEADAEKLKGFLSLVGFNFTEDPMLADLIIFETCAVRHTAQNRILGHIGNLKNLKKMNKNLFIIICGCMVEQDNMRNYIFEKYPYVDMICGAKSLDAFLGLLYEKLTGSKPMAYDYDCVPFQTDKFKSWIPIISGCNNFCSYCIVPYVRGREKSIDYKKILKDCKKQIQNGSKVLTLLGQNVNSYNFEGMEFSNLLTEIDKIDGDFTIRFMTSHPKDFDNHLVDTLSKCKHFSKHLHLPVQSGNNRILSLMNRKYTREEYLGKISYAKKKIKDLVITSDIIIGFPGETEEEFEDTVSLVKEAGFASVFTFIYSPREGTLAFDLPDFVSYSEKVRRISKLIKIQEEISEKIHSKFVGKVFKVLVEDVHSEKSVSRTQSNLMVELPSKFNVGEEVLVKIVSANRNSLVGEKV